MESDYDRGLGEERPLHLQRHFEIGLSMPGVSPIIDTISSSPWGVLRREDQDALKRIFWHMEKKRLDLATYLTGDALTLPLKGGFRSYSRAEIITFGEGEKVEELCEQLSEIEIRREPIELHKPEEWIGRKFELKQEHPDEGKYINAIGYFQWEAGSTIFHPNASFVDQYIMEREEFEKMIAG